MSECVGSVSVCAAEWKVLHQMLPAVQSLHFPLRNSLLGESTCLALAFDLNLDLYSVSNPHCSAVCACVCMCLHVCVSVCM